MVSNYLSIEFSLLVVRGVIRDLFRAKGICFEAPCSLLGQPVSRMFHRTGPVFFRSKELSVKIFGGRRGCSEIFFPIQFLLKKSGHFSRFLNGNKPSFSRLKIKGDERFADNVVSLR